MGDTAPPEKVFRSFSQKQAVQYAQHRRPYHEKLYSVIIDHHTSTGGQLDTVLDVGCGPGTAVRDLALHFPHAIGLDPSEGMISTARSLSAAAPTSTPIRFEVATAEDLGSLLSPPIPDSSVDLITAATAAHWFDMSRFWRRAAQVLKPGGTVAIWTGHAVHMHPSVPNYVAIEATLQKFDAQYIAPYSQPGSLIERNLYIDLPLPWTLTQPIEEFDQSSFYRREWNRDGTEKDSDEFFVDQGAADLDIMEKVFATTSQVTKWRQENSEKVGTEEDIVRILRRDIEKLLHEAGVEKGKELIRGSMSSVLLMVKKKKGESNLEI